CRGRARPRAPGCRHRPRRCPRTAPAPGPCDRRSFPAPALGEVADEEVGVERGEVEAPRRLVDELQAVRAGLVAELLVDPENGLLDRCLTGHASAPAPAPRLSPWAQPKMRLMPPRNPPPPASSRTRSSSPVSNQSPPHAEHLSSSTPRKVMVTRPAAHFGHR